MSKSLIEKAAMDSPVTPQLEMACVYLALGYSYPKAAEALGVSTVWLRVHTKAPRFRKIIDKHQAKLIKLLINAAVVAAYSDLTHTGRIMVPLPPNELSKKKVRKAGITKRRGRNLKKTS